MAKLSPPLIAEAALALGDREGPKAMSMRRIAADLGCDPMAIYRHYPDREALLDAVADLVLAEVTDPGPAMGWADRIHAVLTAVRQAALRHPGIAEHVASRPPLGPHGRQLAPAIAGSLTDAGLDPADVLRTLQALIAYTAAGLRMAVQAGERDARWHQVGQALGGELPVVGSDDQFEFGLRLMLGGVRAYVGQAASRE
jgi:AcrR family transcriptional regulator